MLNLIGECFSTGVTLQWLHQLSGANYRKRCHSKQLRQMDHVYTNNWLSSQKLAHLPRLYSSCYSLRVVVAPLLGPVLCFAAHDGGDSGLKAITRTDGLCRGHQVHKIIKIAGASKTSTGWRVGRSLRPWKSSRRLFAVSHAGRHFHSTRW